MSKTLLIVDRFEGEWAVIEFGKETFELPKSLLPSEVKVGDVLQMQITVDEETTHDRKTSIEARFKRLRK